MEAHTQLELYFFADSAEPQERPDERSPALFPVHSVFPAHDALRYRELARQLDHLIDRLERPRPRVRHRPRLQHIKEILE